MGFGERDVKVRLLGEVGQYTREMGLAGEATGELIQQVVGLDEAVDRTLRRAGQTMLGFGATIGVTTTLWTRSAVQWESAFTNVAKTVNATSGELKGLGTDLRQMSARDIPVAAEGLAQLASLAGQLGVSTGAIDEFTKTAAGLGVATELSAGTAIFAMSQFTNIMGEAEENVENLASALVEMGNTTKTTEGAILDFATRIAGAANVVGLTSAETLGIAAALSSVGVEAERGGTAVQKVLLAMNDAVSRGGDKLASFSNVLGVTQEQFQTMFRSDPSEAFARFVESLQDAGQDATRILSRLDLTDQRLVASFLALANAGEDVRSIMDRSSQAFRDNTALAQETGRFYATVTQKFQQFQNALSEVSRSLGQGFLPPLKLVIDLGTELVNLFNTLPQPIKTFIGLTTGAAAAVLTLVGAYVLLFQKIQLIKWLNLARQTEVFQKIMALLTATVQGAIRAFQTLVLITYDRLPAGLRTGTRATRAFGTALNAMGRAAQFVAANANLILAAVGLLAAAVWASNKAVERAENEFINASEAAMQLADSLGFAIAGFKALEQAANETASSLSFRQQNKELVAQLAAITDEAERLDALRVIRLNLQLQGADPENIKRAITELAASVNMRVPVEFFAEEQDDLDQAVVTRARDLAKEIREAMERQNRVTPGDAELAPITEFLKARAEEISGLLGSESIKDQMRGLDILGSLDDALAEEFGRGEALDRARDAFADYLEKAGLGQELTRGFWDRNLNLDADNPFKALQRLIDQGILPSFEQMELAAEKAGVTLEGTLEQRIEKLMRTQEQWIGSLDDARKELGATQGVYESLGPIIDSLGDRWNELEDSEKSEALRVQANNILRSRGHQATIRLLQEQLDFFIRAGQEYTQHANTIRSELETVTRELEQMQTTALQQLNTLLDRYVSLNQQLEDVQVRHNERMAELEEDRAESLMRARKSYDEQLEGINETFEDRLRERTQSLIRWADLNERVWSERTMSLSGLIANTRIQNEMFDAWQQGLEELRRRGLSQDAIELMGLGDSPRALAQIRTLLQGSADQIGELNALVEQRSARANDFVRNNSQDLVEEMAQARAEALREYQRSVSDIEEQFAETVSDLNEELVDQQEELQKELSELGENTGRDYMTAIEEAMATGIPGLMTMADQVRLLFSDLNTDINRDVSKIIANLNIAENYYGTAGRQGVPARLTGLVGMIPQEDLTGRQLSAAELAQKAINYVGAGTISSGYRDPRLNEAVGGSPTSYHMDMHNPANDVSVDTIAAGIQMFNYLLSNYRYSLRELIYGDRIYKREWDDVRPWTKDDHWDHVHVAHGGGRVSSSWPTIPGLRGNERPAILEIGEGITPASDMRYASRSGFGSPAGSGIVQAVIGALAASGVLAGGERHAYGPITVKADDPRDMERKLEQRARQRRLTRPGASSSGAV